jgi:prepilin-type N-terminal cleavage/methylation domain-containing protein
MKKRGFTLIELLIASSILTIVMMAIYLSFRVGVFGYRDIEDNLQTTQAARMIMKRLDLDLRNSVMYSGDETRFKGDKRTVSFMTVVDTFMGGKMEQDYAFITYRSDNNSILRGCLKNNEIFAVSGPGQQEELACDIEGFTFDYGYIKSKNGPLEWKDSWSDPKALPVAVRVSLSIRGKRSYDCSRVIFLPLANADEKA